VHLYYKIRSLTIYSPCQKVNIAPLSPAGTSQVSTGTVYITSASQLHPRLVHTHHNICVWLCYYDHSMRNCQMLTKKLVHNFRYIFFHSYLINPVRPQWDIRLQQRIVVVSVKVFYGVR